MDSPPPAARALLAAQVPHQVFRHAAPVRSLEQAAAERGQAPGQVVRSILFRLSAGQFVLVLAAGPAQVAWPVLRAHLGTSRLTLASEEEVLQVTGCRIGTVSPLGLPRPLRILADEGVFVNEIISLGSGEKDTAIIMRSADLRAHLAQLEIGRFVQGPG